MRILHYALGFPPYRTGGLTKFCMDLMFQQKCDQHEVALLWPGQMRLFQKKVYILPSQERYGVGSYEIINPLPIPYDEGIAKVDEFMKTCDKYVYSKFLCDYRPDVIHVHTLMGLHKEFLEAAKELGIRTVFTIHDFFSICPKVTMLRNGKICDQAYDCNMCAQCNESALSLRKIFWLQSPLYRRLKDTAIVKIMRKKHREQFMKDTSSDSVLGKTTVSSIADYQRLRRFYESMIDIFDVIHANSSLTKMAFSKIYSKKNITLIPITHADIQNHKRKKDYSHNTLRITYLGAPSRSKGYFLLKEALDELWKTNKTFSLNVYFESAEMPPYMFSFGRYDYSKLESIFEMTDVLVAPSTWYETFGYTVIEALSFGVPVIVSSNVGAKDIIPAGCGIVIEEMTSDKLRKVLEWLSAETLSKMNRAIIDKYTPMTIEEMSRRIYTCCYLDKNDYSKL